VNVRFLGGPLDRTVVYLAPRPDQLVPPEGGGFYQFDGEGIYTFVAGEPPPVAEAEPAEEIRPAPRRRTRRPR
jgi:hypothetical protein